MPGTTPRRDYPYPLPTEPVAQGADAIKNLAEAVDSLQGTLAVRNVAAAVALNAYYSVQWATYAAIGADLPQIPSNGNTGVQVTASGLYEVHAQLNITTTAASKSFLEVLINGNPDTSTRDCRSLTAPAGAWIHNHSAVVYATAGDTLSLRIQATVAGFTIDTIYARFVGPF